MSQDDPKQPPTRPETASKSTGGAAKSRRSAGKDREARLAEALRANLRRRKAPPPPAEGSAGEKEEEL